ncbi:MAG: hypothetical protein NPIRA01_12250 [Nitrospirales bacterium]|nr:MAG: hypothetical protein NPIRA01_12250 [Nitrospirales bacterium]
MSRLHNRDVIVNGRGLKLPHPFSEKNCVLITLCFHQLANRFVSDPYPVVHVNQQVKGTVMEVDIPRKHISLAMKAVPGETP